jgi:poly(3-hydroxybutyrate) depolymerase
MIALFRHAVVAVAVVGLAAAPADKITKESIVSGGQNRAYYLYVPPNAGSTQAPLIVMLHGSGRRGDVLVEAWKGLAKKESIILVGPDASNPRGWDVPQDGPDFLYDVVEAVKRTQHVDPRRVYIFGHSAGAVFGLEMGLIESQYFAAVAVSAGAFRQSDFAVLDYAQRKTPFAVFVGTNDPFYPLAAVRATRDAFVAAGLPFDLTEIKGHDHNYYGRADEINKQAWKFLAGQSLPAEPEFQRYSFRQDGER